MLGSAIEKELKSAGKKCYTASRMSADFKLDVTEPLEVKS